MDRGKRDRGSVWSRRASFGADGRAVAERETTNGLVGLRSPGRSPGADMFGPFGAGQPGIERRSRVVRRASSKPYLKSSVDVPLMVAGTGERANRQNENWPPEADEIDRERKRAAIRHDRHERQIAKGRHIAPEILMRQERTACLCVTY
jgi:hypothetical protein